MADTVELSAGAGGAVVNTDEIGGFHNQIIKPGFGPLDTLTLVTASVGLPVAVLSIAAGANAIGKLAANSGVDIGDVDILSIAAGDNNIGNVDIVTVPAPLSTTGGGTEATALRVTLATDSTGVVSVDDNGGVLTVDGTVTAELGATDNAVLDAIAASVAAIDTDTSTIIGHVDGLEGLIGTTNTNTGATATSLAILDDWDNGASDGASVSGDVAHNAVDAGEPVKIGMVAIAHGAAPTALAAADRTNWYANVDGIPFVMGGHMNTTTQNINITDADGAQTDLSLVGAIAGGSKVVVTHITVTAHAANTVNVACRIGFGTANTPALDAAGIILSHPGIPAGGGVSLGNGGGIIGVGADGAELRMTCADPVTGALDVVVGFYLIPA